MLKEELPALIDAGYTSFKIYMTYDDMKLDDGQILRLLAVARRHGALAMVHAENADCIAWLTEALESAGQIAPKYHATARPMAIEREATHRAITLSELVDVPILIVHVSGREAIEQIRWAHAHGLRIYAETCPQYLFLTADHLDDGYEGAKCVCSPPPRDKANQRVRVGRPRRRPVHDLLVRSRAVPLRRSAGQEAGRPGSAVPVHPERHSRASKRGCRCSFPRACAAAASRSTSSSR